MTAPATTAPVALETPDCLLCGGSEFETIQAGLVDQVWEKPGRFQVERCAACGFHMTRPRPAPGEALGFYYDNAYSGEGGDYLGLRAFYETGAGELLLKVRTWIIMGVTPVGPEDRLLEVGCSYGNYLAVTRELTGCEVHGLDFDEGSIANAVDKEHIKYRTGELSEAGYPDGHFTLVTMFHLLEHVPDPVGTLRAAHRVLAPGGHISVEVPNLHGFWRYVFGRYWLPWFIPQHLSHFSPQTLRRALELAGFEVVHQQSMFFPIDFSASLAMFGIHGLGVPRKEAPRSWKTPLTWALNLALVLGWWLVEVPSSLLFRFVGGSGTQVAIARKPLAAQDRA